jgi:hypothetical protein
MKRLLAAAVGVLAPALALACPVCAQDRSPYSALLVGAMILAPYLVVAVVVRAIRSAGEDP